MSATNYDPVINRLMNLKEFEVKRVLTGPLEFTGGSIPFNIKANQEFAWFTVLALTQKEAEQKVDKWLNKSNLED